MRHTFKKMGGVFLALIMLFSLGACGSSNESSTAPDTQPESTPITENAPEPSDDVNDEESSSAADEEESTSNILVAYFSLAGEQYNVGVIEEGNTSIIAHMIAEQTGADLFEIEAVTPYPETHSELLDVSQEEMANNARPEIVGTVDNMADYDTVFIGYPKMEYRFNCVSCI